mmetsp:Transcript_18798/g.45263  ORF Transcript_18798/g.45263 Transcript_18798/m.45263 type:complete len:200 (+) Transcript_18798:918-1517(+)
MARQLQISGALLAIELHQFGAIVAVEARVPAFAECLQLVCSRLEPVEGNRFGCLGGVAGGLLLVWLSVGLLAAVQHNCKVPFVLHQLNEQSPEARQKRPHAGLDTRHIVPDGLGLPSLLLPLPLSQRVRCEIHLLNVHGLPQVQRHHQPFEKGVPGGLGLLTGLLLLSDGLEHGRHLLPLGGLFGGLCNAWEAVQLQEG